MNNFSTEQKLNKKTKPSELKKVLTNDQYKSMKYHYKCKAKILEKMNKGEECPVGFEKYLGSFTIDE